MHVPLMSAVFYAPGGQLTCQGLPASPQPRPVTSHIPLSFIRHRDDDAAAAISSGWFEVTVSQRAFADGTLSPHL